MAFADTRAATIISHNSQNESVCLANKGKNTVKRWIGKCLHQCNLEIENRDLTKQLYWQHKFYSKVAEHELKFQMLIRFLFQATLSHTFHQYNFYKALLFLFAQDCVCVSNAKEVIIYITLIQRRMLFMKILQKASSIIELPYSFPVKGGRTYVTGEGTAPRSLKGGNASATNYN